MLQRLVLTLVLCFLPLAGCQQGATDVADSTTAAAPLPPAPLADYFQIRRLKDASFSHDDAMVAYLSDEGGRLDVWAQPTAGGEARQLTRADGRYYAFAFSPARDQLLYEVDQGGNGKPRLYLTDSAGSEARELLPDLPVGSRIGFLRWATDGKSFLYIVNLPKKPYVEVFEYDMESGASQKLWQSPANLSLALVSPDLDKMVLMEILSDVNFNLYLQGRGDGEPTLLTAHEGDVAYTATAFSQDGGTLFYTSTEAGEFTALYALDLEDHSTRVVHAADWDVESGNFSNGGRYFYTVTNIDGTPEVALSHAETGDTVPLPAVDGEGSLVPLAFSPSDRYMAAMLHTDTSPRTLYLVDLEESAARRLVEPLPESLRDRTMVAGEAVRIASFDGQEVPALLYRPAGDGPFPAIIHVHGGPNAQAKRSYSGFRQYLVSRGYTVLVPNVRGSTGYGKTWASLDNLDLGGGPLADVVACKQWLVEHAEVDGDRVAILGASYGGYMALAAATFEPQEFAAHVNFFGISDMKTLVESYPAYWKVYASFTYKKWGDPANPEHASYQRQRSPLHFVDQVERPLLVVQGENDPHVPRDQSDRFVAALSGRDVPVYYMVIPGEGHGFSKTANRLEAYAAAERFLARHLLGDTSVEVLPQTETLTAEAAAEEPAG